MPRVNQYKNWGFPTTFLDGAKNYCYPHWISATNNGTFTVILDNNVGVIYDMYCNGASMISTSAALLMAGMISLY